VTDTAEGTPVTDRDIVCVGFNDWNTDIWTNQHHLMVRMAAARNRVLFVESLGLRRPTAASRDVRRMATRLRRGLRGPRMQDGVYVLSPLAVPLHSSRTARMLNARLLPVLVGHAARRLDIVRPILWAYVPQAELLLDALKPDLVVYHCVDDIAAHPRIHADSFRASEVRFAARADSVFCSAPPLAERMRTLASPERVHLMTNVADATHFAQALKEGPIDPSLAILPEPRLVFIGALAGLKVDLPLLRAVARARHDWTIALVGPVGLGDPSTDLTGLVAEPNVHLLGRRRYDELPAVLRGAAVGLIPYRLSQLTASVFPMKVYEYLAAGLPIVATPLPSLEGVPEIIIAQDAESFIEGVARALVDDSPQRRLSRSRAAARHSWEVRLREIDDVLTR
jgi:glycosyltransferase involved in cell wall biosynthesis